MKRPKMFTIKHSNTNYLSHMVTALGFSLRCLGWASRACVHAFIPGVFPDTSVRMVAAICQDKEPMDFDESLSDA